MKEYLVAGVIVAVVALTYLVVILAWRHYVRPWLITKGVTNVDELADMAVRAVEALIGAGHGEEKWKMALEKLSQMGLDVNADVVLDAVKAAWYKLNLQQILAGIKEPEKNETES